MSYLLGLTLAISPVTHCGEIALILEEGVKAEIINQQDAAELIARCKSVKWDNNPPAG